MNRYYKKNKNGLDYLGEGKIVKKSQIKLKEEKFNVMLPPNGNGDIGQSLKYAQKIKASNSNIGSVKVLPNNPSPSMFSNNGNKSTMNVQLPGNPSPEQVVQAKTMAKGNTKSTITVGDTNQQSGSTMSNTANNAFEQKMRAKSKRLMEIRKNSVDFTKSELRDFLRTV